MVSLIFACSACSASNDNNSVKDGSNAIANINGQTYYMGASSLVDITSDTVIPVKTEDNQLVSLKPYKYVLSGNTIYTEIDDIGICKYDFKDSHTVASETVIEKADIEKSICNGSHYFGEMTNWKYINDNIYFIFNSLPESQNVHKERWFQLGVIDTKNSKIELIDNVRTNCFTVDNDYIYFYDNGYTYDSSSNSYNIASDRIGIYRIRHDGSGKLLLKSFENVGSGYNEINVYYDLTIYNNKLYWIDNSKTGESRICCMEKDGNGFEYISTESANCFTIDKDNNMLIYKQGKRSEANMNAVDYYRIDLNTTKQTKVFNYLSSSVNSRIDVYKDCIYYLNEGAFHIGQDEQKGICGEKYDFSSDKPELLYGNSEVELKKEGIVTKRIVKDPEFYWENKAS